MSLQRRMDETGGRSTGFDYLRIGLATGVIVWHAFGLSYGAGSYMRDVMAGPFGPAILLIVPMFFALSGFLVAGSLARSKAISTFVGLRLIRIFPALCVEVCLSALILGPLLTHFSLSDYFSGPAFGSYFLNIIGDIHYRLPGLFASNPVTFTVNGQLWTVPGELKCYLAATLLAITTLIRRRQILVGIVLAGSIYLWLHHSAFRPSSLTNEAAQVPASLLVMCFLAAWVIHSYRGELPWNRWLFVASFAFSIAACLNQDSIYLLPFPVAYATVYLGLTNFSKLFIFRGADYSYGMYLYGFVIQQSIASFGSAMHHWYVNLGLTLPIAATFAAGSWNFIEKPALKLRRVLPRVEFFIDSIKSKLLFVTSATSKFPL